MIFVDTLTLEQVEALQAFANEHKVAVIVGWKVETSEREYIAFPYNGSAHLLGGLYNGSSIGHYHISVLKNLTVVGVQCWYDTGDPRWDEHEALYAMVEGWNEQSR